MVFSWNFAHQPEQPHNICNRQMFLKNISNHIQDILKHVICKKKEKIKIEKFNESNISFLLIKKKVEAERKIHITRNVYDIGIHQKHFTV